MERPSARRRDRQGARDVARERGVADGEDERARRGARAAPRKPRARADRARAAAEASERFHRRRRRSRGEDFELVDATGETDCFPYDPVRASRAIP